MPEPKKRGRKPKAEQEAFKLEVQEKENQKSIYEKKIEEQLPISLETLRTGAPLEPNWGIKKNSEGKNTFLVRLQGAFSSWNKQSVRFTIHDDFRQFERWKSSHSTP